MVHWYNYAGYAAYIWTAYAVVGLSIAVGIGCSWRSLRSYAQEVDHS